MKSCNLNSVNTGDSPGTIVLSQGASETLNCKTIYIMASIDCNYNY